MLNSIVTGVANIVKYYLQAAGLAFVVFALIGIMPRIRNTNYLRYVVAVFLYTVLLPVTLVVNAVRGKEL